MLRLATDPSQNLSQLSQTLVDYYSKKYENLIDFIVIK